MLYTLVVRITKASTDASINLFILARSNGWYSAYSVPRYTKSYHAMSNRLALSAGPADSTLHQALSLVQTFTIAMYGHLKRTNSIYEQRSGSPEVAIFWRLSMLTLYVTIHSSRCIMSVSVNVQSSNVSCMQLAGRIPDRYFSRQTSPKTHADESKERHSTVHMLESSISDPPL